MEMESICRLCLQDGPDLTSVFAEMVSITGPPLEEDAEKLIRLYLPIQIIKSENTMYPAICSDCSHQIEQWHRFYLSCIDNDKIYQQRLLEHQLDSIEFPVPLKEELMDEEEPSYVDQYLEFESVDVGASELTNGDIADSDHYSYDSDFCPKKSKARSKKMQTTAPKKRGRPSLKSKEDKLWEEEMGLNQPRAKKPRALRVESLDAKKKRKPDTKMCPICGKFFVSLFEHLRHHQNDKKYQCSHCEKKFIGRSNYLTHLNIHTREKMFKCTLCDRQYMYTKSLKMHMISHAGERTFQCTVCKKMFLQKSSMERHMRNHFEEPKIKCDECGHLFYARGDLNKHMKTHQSFKEFSCEICGRAFGRKDNLRTHMKVHQKKPKDTKTTDYPPDRTAVEEYGISYVDD
ncbi:zinc finger protein 2 [Aedes albopictus]|uniref:C2h2-type zn-finger protein n=1 Tax=Aedes albopictus TaxID=7160 RepID=A0ABM2A2G1_AEDAL